MIFKNQYYYFISGLPELFFDLPKPPLSIQEFKEMLHEHLVTKDKRLLQSFYLSFDKDNLLRILRDRESKIDELGTFSQGEWLDMILQIKEELPIENKKIPNIYETFIRAWLEHESKDLGEYDAKLWEDELTSLSFNYGRKMKNTLIARWFELNLNIGNILAAINSRKYGMDVAQVIVGDNEIAQTIRENLNQRDFGLTIETPLYEVLHRISEEKDLFERERKLDKLRWDWLDENTVFDYFDIEYLFSYLCKLHIIDRWSMLQSKQGEVVFRNLIENLQSEVTLSDE